MCIFFIKSRYPVVIKFGIYILNLKFQGCICIYDMIIVHLFIYEFPFMNEYTHITYIYMHLLGILFHPKIQMQGTIHHKKMRHSIHLLYKINNEVRMEGKELNQLLKYIYLYE